MLNFQKFAYLYDKEVSGNSDLSMNEERLLQSIAGQWFQMKEINVQEVVNLSSVSHATTYKTLKSLKQKNYIVMRQDDVDSRWKYVEPGPSALKYMKQMDDLILRAAIKIKAKKQYRSMVFWFSLGSLATVSSK